MKVNERRALELCYSALRNLNELNPQCINAYIELEKVLNSTVVAKEPWERFDKWYAENESRFENANFNEKEIAYSAYLAGLQKI